MSDIPKVTMDMGDKKRRETIQKHSKFYDDHKAGRRDPKTGVYYRHLPTSKAIIKISSKGIANITCIGGCGNCHTITRATILWGCFKCHTLNKINVDKITDEVEVTKA